MKYGIVKIISSFLKGKVVVKFLETSFGQKITTQIVPYADLWHGYQKKEI